MLIEEIMENHDSPHKTWKHDLYTFKYFIEGVDEGYIQVLANDELIGSLFFARDPDTTNFVGSVEVASEYQRKGIATKLYNYAEQITGEAMTPDTTQTNDAKAFWKSRNA